MRTFFALFLVAFAFIVATPRLASADAAADKMAERAMRYVESVANVIDANRDDCKKMGDALEAFVSSTAEERAAIKAYKDKLTPEQRAEYARKYAARIHAATAKIAAGAQACGSNAKVRDAMAELRDGL